MINLNLNYEKNFLYKFSLGREMSYHVCHVSTFMYLAYRLWVAVYIYRSFKSTLAYKTFHIFSSHKI